MRGGCHTTGLAVAILAAAQAIGACAATSVGAGQGAAERAPAVRPVPPSDLDARLRSHYPLRGLVLGESGQARVRFAVSQTGAVEAREVLAATHAAYGRACAAMLSASVWTPAERDGRAVPYEQGQFVCRFEHADNFTPRLQAPQSAATPPVQPDYGSDWWSRFSDDFVRRDASAELEIAVDAAGGIEVLSTSADSDPALAQVCEQMLESGPAWTPARDATGRPVRYQTRFPCRLEVRSPHKELRIREVSAAGPLAPDTVAEVTAQQLGRLAQCFRSAVDLGKNLHGLHWIAFEILSSGRVRRVEWVESAHSDAAFDACVTGAVRRWRFPSSEQATIADLKIELGGLNDL